MAALQYQIVGQEDGTKNVTVFRPGDKPLVARSDHMNYEKIIEGLLKDDEKVYDLFDVSFAVGMKFQRLTDRITVANGQIFIDGEQMDNALIEQIVRFLQEGVEDWKPLVKFYDNLLQNPNPESVTELYSWISAHNITITEDGMILGYKGLQKVTDKNKDSGYAYESASAGKAIVDGVVYEGRIPQDVGAIVEMPRSDVEYNPRQDCGVGLHVGDHAYARSYARPGFFEVHINPRDVVSVPDHGQKLRCCRYVIAKNAKPDTKPETPLVVKDGKTKAATNAAKPKVNKGDVYEDNDPRRPRKLKVLTNVAGLCRVENTETGKKTNITAKRLQERFTRIKRGR